MPEIVEVPGVKAIGPYSHAVKAGGLAFVSRQPGIDLASGTKGATFAEQGWQAFENLRVVLEAAGSGMDRLVSTTCLLGDVSSFPELNALFAEYFAASPPARMAMQVPLPLGCCFRLGAWRWWVSRGIGIVSPYCPCPPIAPLLPPPIAPGSAAAGTAFSIGCVAMVGEGKCCR